MAKGKRSNSPKRSRRGGRKSPKKSKQGVQKKIYKDESEPAHLHELKDVEEPDCECDLENDAEEQEKLPKMAEQVPVKDAETVKPDLVQFFWDSYEEGARAELMSLSQHEEQFFLFGKVGAELAKSSNFTEEVENNLAMVSKADEAWVRSLLAGEVELPKPEEPEAPMEQVEEVEAETVEEATEKADVEVEAPKDEVEVAAEVAAEAPVPEVAANLTEVVEPNAVVEPAEVTEEKVYEDVAMADVMGQFAAEVGAVEGAPAYIQEFVSEPVINKENPMIAEAVKTVSAKLGEQPVESAADGPMSPKDLNAVQPLGLA
jgi:hypothetical protein